MSRTDPLWQGRAGEIEEHVEQLLSDYDIRDPGGLQDLDALAWALGASVRRKPLNGSEARLIRDRRRGIITIDSEIGTLGQMRFAVSHELGHFRLHESQDQRFLCSAEDMIDFYRRSSLEREANWFAANLLMPASMLRKGVSSAEPSIRTVKKVAMEFGASLTATAVRCVDLSREACAVVVSTQDGVRWWRISERFPFAIDKRLPRLPPTSFAHDALQGETVPEHPSEVDADDWLYFVPHGGRLKESSMLLGRTGSCLTMLWFLD